jgi:hypothetical protein
LLRHEQSDIPGDSDTPGDFDVPADSYTDCAADRYRLANTVGDGQPVPDPDPKSITYRPAGVTDRR